MAVVPDDNYFMCSLVKESTVVCSHHVPGTIYCIFNSNTCGFGPFVWESWLNSCLVPNLPPRFSLVIRLGNRIFTDFSSALTCFEIKYCMKFKMYAKSIKRCRNPRVRSSQSREEMIKEAEKCPSLKNWTSQNFTPNLLLFFLYLLFQLTINAILFSKTPSHQPLY